MKTRLRLARSNQKGITGLETAIILIAFVMVASVFAYVVLSAGLFSSQKAKEAVNAGLQEVRSNVELKGDVLAVIQNGVVTDILFTLGTHPNSEPIDFTDTLTGNNKVIISYHDAYQVYPSLEWTLNKLNTSTSVTSDNLLDQNELFQIDVNVRPATDNATSEQAKLAPYHTFTLEVKPPTGAILPIERTIPARLDAVLNLQ